MTGRWLVAGSLALLVLAGSAIAYGLISSDSLDAVASLEALEDEGVIHLKDLHVFLVYNDGDLLALSDDAQHAGDRVEFCESSQMFESPAHGEKFDIQGYYYGGPARRGLAQYPVRIEGDGIYVDFEKLFPGPGRGDPPARDPVGPLCVYE
jgi:nitrite reductase/ring-hydroxylating ferredoxin subunit